MAFQLEVAARGADRLGECPLWDERQKMLWWVDSRWLAVKQLEPSSGAVMMLVLPEVIGSIALRAQGGLLAATKSGIHLLDPSSGTLEARANTEALLPENRFNDGRCNRQGRFWAGTMCDVRRDPTGSLYRHSNDHPLNSLSVLPVLPALLLLCLALPAQELSSQQQITTEELFTKVAERARQQTNKPPQREFIRTKTTLELDKKHKVKEREELTYRMVIINEALYPRLIQ